MKDPNQKQIRKNTHVENVLDGVKLLQEGSDMQEALAQFARSCGKDAETSDALAFAVLQLVRSYDEAFEAAQYYQGSEFLYPLFRKLRTLAPAARIEALDTLLFSLEIFESDDLVRDLEHASPSALYQKYRQPATLPINSETETRLEDRLAAKFRRLNLSEQATKRFLSQVERGAYGPVNTAAIGKEALQFKCAAALAIYLDNENEKTPFTLDQAVSIACTNHYMHTIAEAVHLGQVTEEYAVYLFAILVFLAVWLPTAALAIAFPPAIFLAPAAPTATVFGLLYGVPAASKATGRLVARLYPKLCGTMEAVDDVLFRLWRKYSQVRKAVKDEIEEFKEERRQKELEKVDPWACVWLDAPTLF